MKTESSFAYCDLCYCEWFTMWQTIFPIFFCSAIWFARISLVDETQPMTTHDFNEDIGWCACICADYIRQQWKITDFWFPQNVLLANIVHSVLNDKHLYSCLFHFMNSKKYMQKIRQSNRLTSCRNQTAFSSGVSFFQMQSGKWEVFLFFVVSFLFAANIRIAMFVEHNDCN